MTPLNCTQTRIHLFADRCDDQKRVPATKIKKHAPYRFFLLVTAILLADATGCSYLERTPPNGKISVQAVSWTLVQKLAEPDAGLSGHKVTILNRADRSVIASGTTDSSGIVEFDVPQGTYTLLGASDEPQSVRVQAGQTVRFKLVVHGKLNSRPQLLNRQNPPRPNSNQITSTTRMIGTMPPAGP